jgi:hypothetical protein
MKTVEQIKKEIQVLTDKVISLPFAKAERKAMLQRRRWREQYRVAKAELSIMEKGDAWRTYDKASHKKLKAKVYRLMERLDIYE